MTQPIELNDSSPSLPSYPSTPDPPPSYGSVINRLSEPARAYIAKQRDALTNIARRNATTGNTQQNDTEAQHRNDSDSTITRISGRRRQPLPGRSLGRIWFDIALLMFVAILASVFWVLITIMKGAGRPTIMPPYPNKETWWKCKLDLDPYYTFWFWTLGCTWELGLLSWGIALYIILVRANGDRYVALKQSATIVVLLGGTSFMAFVGIRKMWCPKMIVPGMEELD